MFTMRKTTEVLCIKYVKLFFVMREGGHCLENRSVTLLTKVKLQDSLHRAY